MSERSCLDCGTRISHLSTGRCWTCARALRSPESEAKRLAAVRVAMRRPETLAKKRVERLHWCPPKYRPAYRHLRKRKGFSAAEAQAMIREQMAADTRGLDPLAAAIIQWGLAA